MGTKRSNFSLVPMGGKLVAAGGYDGRGVTYVVEVGTNPQSATILPYLPFLLLICWFARFLTLRRTSGRR